MRDRSLPDGQRSEVAFHWSGRIAGLLLASTPLAIAPVRAWAQAAGEIGSVLTGGGLRGTLEALLPNRPRVNTGLAWSTQGSISVNVGATDNPGGLNNGLNNNQHQWSLTTYIQPSLSLAGDSARLSAQLSYSPALVLYSNSNGQNQLSHYLNAGATATLVPDHLFVDVRGYATDQPSYGSNPTGVVNTVPAAITSGSATQVVGASISPYYIQRFGGWGTLRAGYTLSHIFVGNRTNTANTVRNNSLPGFGSTGSLTTSSEYISFGTGENFDRFNYGFNATTSQDYGGGSTYSSGGNYNINNSFSYAVSRAVTLLSNIGYQSVSYGGATRFQSDYVNWNVGTRLTPNADSSLTVQYGESQGSSTWLFNGRYAPTPRLSFYGTYNTSITTYLQQQQALLQNTVVGPNGILIDQTTGAPVSAINPLGIQNAPSRVYTLTFGAAYVVNRESFSASISRTTTTTLTQSSSVVGTTVPSGTTGTGTSGSLSWQHDIDPITNLTSSIGYGVSDSGVFLGRSGGSLRTLSATAALSRTFTATLTGNISYSYYDRSGLPNTAIQGAGSSTQNVFLVGLRKTF